MARIRTIKPEFWTSEQIMELSPMARLAFIGLWNFCDDRGVHPASPKTLKAEVFPADDVTSADVAGWIGEMVATGLLLEFSANDRNWWSVTGWHHQLINRPSKSRYPEPPRHAPLPSAAGQDDSLSAATDTGENGAADHGGFHEDSLRAHGAITDDSLTEGKGKEGKGVNPLSVALASAEPIASAREAVGKPTGKAATDPPSPATEPAADATPAGVLCARIRAEGIADANPQHPKLLALMAAGITGDEIAAAAADARARGKGFAYALATAEGRRRDAAKLAPLPAAAAPPWWSSNELMVAKGRELGLKPRPGEEWPQFRARVAAKMAEQAGQAA